MKKYPILRCRLLYPVILVLVFFLCLGSSAVAREKSKSSKKREEPGKTYGKYTQEQLSINAMAASATKDKDYAKAERLFQASLDLGSLDVLWLNLGRTYARQGKCLEAREAYNNVETAPVLKDSGIDIKARLFRFRYELDEECAEQFARMDSFEQGVGGFFTEEQVSLNAQAAEATMAGDFERAVELFQVNLKLGEFDITWLNLGRTYAKANQCIKAREAYSHVLSAPASRESANIKLESILEQFQSELLEQCEETFIEYDSWEKVSFQYNVAGWTLLGVGVAGMIASISIPKIYSPYVNYFEEDVNSDYLNRFNSYKNKMLAARISTGAIGAAAALAGIGVLIADYIQFGDRKKKNVEQPATEQEIIQANIEIYDENSDSEIASASSEWRWFPAVSIHPEFSSVGAVLVY